MAASALMLGYLTDETFVVASARGQLSAAWMAGLNLAAWGTWALANIAGGALSGYAGNIRALAFALALLTRSLFGTACAGVAVYWLAG